MFDLKAFRNKNNIKQSGIAEKIGIQRTRLSRYENGKDRSNTISKLLLQHYPEIVEFEIDENEEWMDFKQMYNDAKQKNLEMQEINDNLNENLKQALAIIEKLVNQDK